MLNIIKQLGNANQNHNALSPHTCQNGWSAPVLQASTELFAQQQTPGRHAQIHSRYKAPPWFSLEGLLKIAPKRKGTGTFIQTTPLPLSLQWLPGCLNQGRQEQTVRQIVICRLLVSSGSFPPVQREKQAALSYGQGGPMARRLAHSSS